MLTRKSVTVILASLVVVTFVACAVLARRTLPAVQPTPAAPTLAGSSGCSSPYRVGYRVMNLDGVKAAIWYPSATAETPFTYSRDISSSLAQDGQPLTSCGTFPLVVFSHGLSGCGTQSIFFTETLARQGYVVVAPDHHDALLCSVDGTRPGFAPGTESPILDPKTWNDSSYQDRKNDVEQVINSALFSYQYQQ